MEAQQVDEAGPADALAPNRRRSDRRSGADRRDEGSDLHEPARRLSWEDQRTQYLTRLLFCTLGLIYFNYGGMAQVSSWTNMAVVNTVLIAYGAEIIFFMWHTVRQPHVPWRQRLTMWIDIVATSFAVLADSTVSSPGFLAFLMVILGNGMRYGLRLFAEAVIGSLACAILVVSLRLFDYVNIFSVSAVFFLLFFAIIVLYSYSLTANIERSRLKLAEERNVDSLTGLLNRRALHERATHLFQHPEMHGGEVVVLFADLDRFKAVNDTHGHNVGDRVLAAVGKNIATIVRGADLVARYGGDEFLLILPGTSTEGGVLVAERLRETIEKWAHDNGIDLSVSIGLGLFPRHGDDLDSVVACVDQAMYRSKLVGRGGILHVDSASEAAPSQA